jgi:hypothetical protein
VRDVVRQRLLPRLPPRGTAGLPPHMLELLPPLWLLARLQKP